MQFVLYTDKTVAQCMNALNERMHAKATKARPELGGWIEKSGAFSLSVSSKVLGRFSRRTRLSAQVKRERSITVIRGRVSEGISPYWLRVLGLVAGVLAVVMILSNQPMLAVVTLLFAGIGYIPLRGDYINCDILLIEVERTLHATPKPPKK